jgi:hypothetical protein
MTDEIILSAAEACGLLNDCLDVETMSVCILAFTKFMVGVELFKEREACAKLCEDYGRAEEMQAIGNDYAAAIRARGEQA